MEQDQYEARLKELFDSFDATGTGSLGQEELTDLCVTLQLEDVASSLQQALLQDNPHGRVHFDQFKEALIDELSSKLSDKDSFEEADCSPEVQPKYIKDGKKYGRRSVPELQDSLEEFDEDTVIEPEDEGTRSSQVSSRNCEELWKSQDGEEYEAEGQLRFWNPDDLGASQTNFSPSQDWMEEKLQLVCDDLGITRDGHLNRKKLISICEQYGFQNIDKETLEDAFQNLDQDDTMSFQDFFSKVCRNTKPLTPSVSTPYRHFKRHLSMQPYDESGRRTITPLTMTGCVGFSLFSKLDDGTGYGSVEDIIDLWQEDGVENGQAVIKALDFNVEGKINLSELTLTLENELLMTKNEVYQAALTSFRSEIRHLLESAEQVAREKDKLRSDLEKNERFKSLMASEVDDHHAAIERRNEYNLSKLDEEYKERTSALRSELRKEREQILQLSSRQRQELEQELDKVKTEENVLRDHLMLSLKESSRLETELLETSEKLIEYETLASKLQKSLDNVLREKFGDLDPSCIEFFRQEEKLAQMRNEYERQRRELQDRIDELQLELEEYRLQGVRGLRSPTKHSLSFEMDSKNVVECDQGIGSEECPPLNMSIEAEMAIEQMREQHQREVEHLTMELESKANHYEEQVKEIKCVYEREKEMVRIKSIEESQRDDERSRILKVRQAELEADIVKLKAEQQGALLKHKQDIVHIEADFDNQRVQLTERETSLRHQLDQTQRAFDEEKEELVMKASDLERDLENKLLEVITSLEMEKEELERNLKLEISTCHEKLETEKHELAAKLVEEHQNELQEEICSLDLVIENFYHPIRSISKEGHLPPSCNKHADALLLLIYIVFGFFVQVSELKTKNLQLESQNADLSVKNTKNQTDIQELNQRLLTFRKQRGKKESKGLEEWQREKRRLKDEIEVYKSKVGPPALSHSVRFLQAIREELSLLNPCHLSLVVLFSLVTYFLQLLKSSDLSNLKKEISALATKNEHLIKEKETLNEELNISCAKVGYLESKIASLKQEQKTFEQQSQGLKGQLAGSQDKVQSLEDNLKSVNTQISRIRSDLRVAQQEKEALKQEVMSLHKQLQNANAKNQVLEMAVHSSGLQNNQKKLYWNDLEQLMEQEQKLLRQENERLQREVQNTKTDLHQSRDKVRQLESMALSLKHEKQQSHASMVRGLEQEKLSLRRECDQLQKELAAAHRKVRGPSGSGSPAHHEWDGMSGMTALHSNSSVALSRSPLQQQASATSTMDQYLQRQQQADRRNQQPHATSRSSDSNSPQSDQEQLLQRMETRMMEVEQKLRIVKMLLQEKVNQLKEQCARNTKADAKIKDLYVENSQLLKALQMSEQRHQTAVKKNYLLEEKISGLNKIVKDLAPSALTPGHSLHRRPL
uniref:Ninein n=1 Tax=Leptobrachium leishanense TaxID=445787 RepID=A0A8C5MV87_9ANUR